MWWRWWACYVAHGSLDTFYRCRCLFGCRRRFLALQYKRSYRRKDSQRNFDGVLVGEMSSVLKSPMSGFMNGWVCVWRCITPVSERKCVSVLHKRNSVWNKERRETRKVIMFTQTPTPYILLSSLLYYYYRYTQTYKPMPRAHQQFTLYSLVHFLFWD